MLVSRINFVRSIKFGIASRIDFEGLGWNWKIGQTDILTLWFVDREQNEAELVEGLRYWRLTAMALGQFQLRWRQDR